MRALPRTAAQLPARTAGQAPPTAVSDGLVPARPPTAGERLRLAGAGPPSRARVLSAGAHGVRPTAERGETTGRLKNAAARPSARVTSHDGQAVAPGQAAASGAPAVPAKTASRAGRPGPRRATGRDGPRPAVTRVAGPGPGALRAGPPIVTVPVAGVQPPPATADRRQPAGRGGRASLVRRVPPAAATGTQVRQGRAHTARAGTTPTGARPGRAVSDPAPIAGRIGPIAAAATPTGGRLVIGRQDRRVMAPATGRRGRPAPAAATAPGAANTIGATITARAAARSVQSATAPGAATAPGTATAPEAATVPGAVSALGAVTVRAAVTAPGTGTALGAAAVRVRAPGAAGPGGTRRRPGHPARPARSFRTRSLPSSSIPRRGPN